MLDFIERHAIRKQWHDHVKIALVYPAPYRAAMTSLAVHYLYFLMNNEPKLLAERVFYTRQEIPRSLESNMVLTEFDIIAVSIGFEFGYLDFIKMLLLSGINPLREERDAQSPPIIVGGPAVAANPYPLAGIADAIFIGELEPIEQDFIRVLTTYRTKKSLLQGLRELPGFLVLEGKQESFHGPVPRERHFKDVFYPIQQIIPQVPETHPSSPSFGKALLLEVNRGCSSRCRFCLVGHIRWGTMNRPFPVLTKIIEDGLRENQVSKVAMLGSSVSSHPKFLELCQFIVDKNATFSVPSLRADKVTPELLEVFKQAKQRTITFAPETGSESLRLALRKKITNDQLYQAIQTAKNEGFNQIKLYLIYGLPGETEQDLEETIHFAQKINKIIKGGRLSLSINPFIIKAGTSFQYSPYPTLEEFRKKQKFLLKGLRKIPGVRLEFYDPRLAIIQSIISIGTSDLSEILVDVAKYGGGLGAWRRAFNERNKKLHDILKTRIKEQTTMPWNTIHKLNADFLTKDYLKFLKQLEQRNAQKNKT